MLLACQDQQNVSYNTSARQSDVSWNTLLVYYYPVYNSRHKHTISDSSTTTEREIVHMTLWPVKNTDESTIHMTRLLRQEKYSYQERNYSTFQCNNMVFIISICLLYSSVESIKTHCYHLKLAARTSYTHDTSRQIHMTLLLAPVVMLLLWGYSFKSNW